MAGRKKLTRDEVVLSPVTAEDALAIVIDVISKSHSPVADVTCRLKEPTQR